MRQRDLARVREVAARTRAKFIEVVGPLFEELDVNPDDLGGACALASWVLVRELRRAGFAAELEGNDEHVWVRCGRWRVDITATQFGLGEVEISERTEQVYMASFDIPIYTDSASHTEVLVLLSAWDNANARTRNRIARRWDRHVRTEEIHGQAEQEVRAG